MTVKELIELLGQLPQDTLVVLSSDGEGNSYSPITEDYSIGYYIPDSTWSGEFWDEGDEDAHEDCDHDEDGDDDCNVTVEPPDGAVPCIVLWPTN